METQLLFEQLKGRGFQIRVEGDEQLFITPRAELTAEEATLIRDRKRELISLVKQRPYLTETGELVIPIHTFKKYQYWAGGQSVFQTLADLNAPLAFWMRYAVEEPAILSATHLDECKDNVLRCVGFICCTACGWWYGTAI